MSCGSFKNYVTNKLFAYKSCVCVCVCVCVKDLALNNQQRLICHKTQPTFPRVPVESYPGRPLFAGWGAEFLLLCMGFSQRILSPADNQSIIILWIISKFLQNSWPQQKP